MPVAKSSQHAIEVVESITAVGRICQDVVEVLWAQPTASPTTPTGAGVSQDCIEVVIAVSAPDARVSMDVIEVLMSGDGASPSSGSVTRISGYVE